MANKLKAITTKAKALYKSGKFKKWTDAIKAASKSIGATAKPVKKAKKETASKAKSYHKDTKSHNVNIRVVSGLSKITGIPHKGKYYIDYKKNGVSYIDYFDKLPNGYYKGMDRVLYKSMLTDYGTTLVPIRNVKTGKPVKK